MRCNKILTLQPIKDEIRKIVLYFKPENTWLCGLQFYGANGKCIYESACKDGFKETKHEILLNEGEKIIGVVSHNDGDDANH